MYFIYEYIAYTFTFQVCHLVSAVISIYMTFNQEYKNRIWIKKYPSFIFTDVSRNKPYLSFWYTYQLNKYVTPRQIYINKLLFHKTSNILKVTSYLISLQVCTLTFQVKAESCINFHFYHISFHFCVPSIFYDIFYSFIFQINSLHLFRFQWIYLTVSVNTFLHSRR